MDTVTIRETSVKYGRSIEAPARISSPEDIASIVREVIDGDAREHLVVLHLDTRMGVIGYQIASIGTANASLVHPREVFQAAIHIGAVQIAMAHNHPSGDASPSEQDRGVTERIASAGEILGIKLLDHVVVTDDGLYSFRESSGLLIG